MFCSIFYFYYRNTQTVTVIFPTSLRVSWFKPGYMSKFLEGSRDTVTINLPIQQSDYDYSKRKPHFIGFWFGGGEITSCVV
ncbi:hypothetical protein I7I48_11802 [Histoplasma ohiense]|nr:hypothetical protein I7I48_11802 [Histoplasma ohiense (nom. inval.)]